MIKKRREFSRGEKNSIKFISVFQIFLMISFVFTFSVILHGRVVSGEIIEIEKGVFYDNSGGALKRVNPDGSPFGSSATTSPVTQQTSKDLKPIARPLKAPPTFQEEKGSTTPTPVTSQRGSATTDASVSGAVAGVAIASNAFTDEIDKLYGVVDGSSDATSAVGLTNFEVPVTAEIQTTFEKSGMSNIELNTDQTLKSFVKDGKLHEVDPTTGVVTSTNIKEFELLGTTFTGPFAYLFEGIFWASIVVGGIQLFGTLFGFEQETVNALSTAATVGIMTGELASYFANEQSVTWLQGSFGGLSTASWVGVGIGVLVFLLMYKTDKQEVISFECRPWQAPIGGSDCEACNDKFLPCSEYQCRSLGQACDIINKGTTEEKCVWVSRQDVNPPTIEPLEDALLTNYRYIPDGTISPPDRGVNILFENSRDNCIPAFTPLKFGVQLNEPATCKIDTLRKETFEEMRAFMSSGILKKEHEFSLSLPGSSALNSNNITLINDGDYEMFVRCQDANGNANTATFVFRYCVDKGPDTTPPVIVTTSILNGLPIGFNQSSILLDVFVNEPADCKWSHNDRDYESMEESMVCSSNVFDFNAQSLYKCSTTLTGLKNKIENDFYFRCKDKPLDSESDRNVNTESFKFTLLGTQPLVIDSVTPNETTISDSTDTVKVTLEAKTSAGHDKGKAICYYSDTGDENDFVRFFNTVSFEHSQDLFLLGGSYEYFIKCTDLGGNTDRKSINFNVEVDNSPPNVVRVYKEEDFLKIVTNEDAKCVYSTFECGYEFEEGTPLTAVNGTGHFTKWTTESNLYVKCQDDHGNTNLPNECGIVVKPSNF